MRIGGIEAGGTKWICCTGEGRHVEALEEFGTTTPGETLERAAGFFERHRVEAIGISCFGPVELHRDSPRYGYITTTPKEGWRNTDVAGTLARRFGIPVGFDTDVNGALLGEQKWGAGRGLRDVVYLTVGTGIGGAAMANGELVHGLLHTEMGHILVRRAEGDGFGGVCPFHGDCLEGLASGTAIHRRWGVAGENLPGDHRAWEVEAHYLAHAVQTLVCLLSPQRVIVGGSVSYKDGLLEKVRSVLPGLLRGYFQVPDLLEGLEQFVVLPELREGTRQSCGYIGAMLLGERALAGGI